MDLFARRQAAQPGGAGEVRAASEQRTVPPAGVAERLGRRRLDDHPGRPVGPHPHQTGSEVTSPVCTPQPRPGRPERANAEPPRGRWAGSGQPTRRANRAARCGGRATDDVTWMRLQGRDPAGVRAVLGAGSGPVCRARPTGTARRPRKLRVNNPDDPSAPPPARTAAGSHAPRPSSPPPPGSVPASDARTPQHQPRPPCPVPELRPPAHRPHRRARTPSAGAPRRPPAPRARGSPPRARTAREAWRWRAARRRCR